MTLELYFIPELVQKHFLGLSLAQMMNICRKSSRTLQWNRNGKMILVKEFITQIVRCL